jgi:hypothetical protein
MVRRAAKYTSGCGLRLRAPRSPSGTEMIRASSVPHSAMQIVTTHCHAYSPMWAKDGWR